MLRILSESFLVFVAIMLCSLSSSQENKPAKPYQSKLKSMAFIQATKNGENFLWIRLTSHQYRFIKAHLRLHQKKSVRTVVRNHQYLAIKEALRAYFIQSKLFPEKFILQVSDNSLTTIKGDKDHYVVRNLELFLQKIQMLQETESNVYEERFFYDEEEEANEY